MPQRIAYLTGTYRRPLLRLKFARRDGLKDGTALIDWVKALPGRRWNPEERAWDVVGIGKDPERTLKRAGFSIDTDTLAGDASLSDVWNLDDLVDPILKLSSKRPSVVLVRPRLAGFEIARGRLGPGAKWDRKTGRFEMPVTDVLTAAGKPKPGLIIDPRAIQAAKEARSRGVAISNAAELAGAKDIAEAGAAGTDTIAKVGDLPKWFGEEAGLSLYPYQRAGAIAAAGGHYLLADEPGLGKSYQALAAVAIRGRGQRLLIISPPVALTHWAREVEVSGMLGNIGAGKPLAAAGQVAVITAKRKEPELPARGVVVVSDSLVSSRPALAQALANWVPTDLIVDEVHRHKTWESARATAVRELAQEVRGLRVAISGTPMFANPVELASPLAITGQLDPIFGGYSAFVSTYARQNHFKAWVANKKELPELRRIFDQAVWVRRRKDDVVDLPPMVRQEVMVDVDLSGFRKAHREVARKVSDWLEDFVENEGRLPDEDEVGAYARVSIALTSMLRRAAGLTKVNTATEWIIEWTAANPAQPDAEGNLVFDRPLVVWTHHRAVTEAMAKAVPAAVGGAKTIIGGTSQDERSAIVDDFQAGKVPVLVASITAAGVGITLTRSSDALFVETDWTPALVQQSERRINRIGSTRSAILRTMVAPGTLDERVQKVLATKAELLTTLMGEGQDVSVVDFDADEGTAPAQIIAEIARGLIAKKAPSAGASRAA